MLSTRTISNDDGLYVLKIIHNICQKYETYKRTVLKRNDNSMLGIHWLWNTMQNKSEQTQQRLYYGNKAVIEYSKIMKKMVA
jgi:hypothetical protein